MHVQIMMIKIYINYKIKYTTHRELVVNMNENVINFAFFFFIARLDEIEKIGSQTNCEQIVLIT